jgi:hypothetical protein
MHFFLYEIVARLVAIYLFVDCSRQLRNGLVERKIGYFAPDVANWFMDWSRWAARRDATPVQYWMQIGFRVIGLVACLFVAIFGWWQPNA